MRKYKELLQLYKHPFTLIRLGRNRDGGYVVPKELLCKNFLSCGIANEISFENDYVKNCDNANIHCFDGTINSFPSENAKLFNWHKLNVDKVDGEKTISMNTIIDKFFKGQNELFVKMDIEGWEYQAFETMTDENIDKIKCMVLEVHFIDQRYSDFETLLNKLSNFLVLVHKHDNHFGKYFDYENEHLPNVYELTFVHKKYIKNKEASNIKLPIDGLDFVN